MGEQRLETKRDGESHRSFIRCLLRDLQALEIMIDRGLLETDVRRIGAEQEVFLVDSSRRPALKAVEVLATIDDDHFTTELAQFNLEANLDPLVFESGALRKMESQLLELLNKAEHAARQHGTSVVLAGILPTIRKSDLSLESMTPYPRYAALNDILCRLRGGAYDFHIKGLDDLAVKHDNVMVESCNTSFQVHFQVGPEEFAELYNIAQLVAAPLLSASVNAPLLFGRRLWCETRIALFEQSIDTRGSAHHLRERAPRVSFGRDWVRESVVELFKEDIVRFRAILATEGEDEDPLEVLRNGGIPKLRALRLHNGTVYRWNRACYGITDGRPHLRIENRILPAGPSPRDEVGSAALWFGLISALREEGRPIASYMDFAKVKANFVRAARYGLDAVFDWTKGRSVRAQDLLMRRLIPMAREGLIERGIDAAECDEYLGVVKRRVRRHRTGADWMLLSLQAMGSAGSLSERLGALVAGMRSRQASGAAVADWALATLEESGGWRHHYMRVEQYMTTDLFTVKPDESIDLVARIMDWQRIRHVPVEDDRNRLIGLVSYRNVLNVLYQRKDGDPPTAVSTVMKRELHTVGPETRTLDAIRLMRRERIGCLPIVKNGRLVGIVTERDFMVLARDLMEQALAEDSQEPTSADSLPRPVLELVEGEFGRLRGEDEDGE